MAFNKKAARLRRSLSTRLKIREGSIPRLSVFFSNKHVYAQILASDGSKVFAAASTVQAEVSQKIDSEAKAANKIAAGVVGRAIAEKAREQGISKVAFDRSGYKYHGRVSALADAAREAGLNF